MTKLLLCSISVFVLGVCIVQPVYAKQVTVPEDVNTQQKVASTERRYGGSYISKKQEPTDIPRPTAKDTKYKELILDAVSLHNFAGTVRSHIEEAENFKMTKREVDLDKANMKEFESCQIGLLANYFRKPEDVWERLKKAAEEKIQQYNLQTVENAAQIESQYASTLALSSEQKQKTESEISGKYADGLDMYSEAGQAVMRAGQKQRLQDLETMKNRTDSIDPETAYDYFDDAMMEWKAGYVILNDFYANQDKWGDRKTENAPSLPLWTDQKYLYTRDVWKPKYKKIVSYCEEQGIELTMKEPKIEDKYKYDYNAYEAAVVPAHEMFLSAARSKGCMIGGDLAEAPEAAPRPLPPVDEEIFLLGRSVSDMSSTASNGKISEKLNIPVLTASETSVVGVYPQTPKNLDKNGNFVSGTLWEAYKRNSFNDVASKGEFRQYFDTKLRLTPKTENLGANRISRYFELKNAIDLSEDTYNSFVEDSKDVNDMFKETINEYDLKIEGDVDSLKVADLKKLYEAVRQKEAELIKQAKEELSQKGINIASMTTEQILSNEYLYFLKALEKDSDAIVFLTSKTASEIDKSIKEAKAEKILDEKFNEEVLKEEQSRLQKKNRKLDPKNCLLGVEGTSLINLNK